MRFYLRNSGFPCVKVDTTLWKISDLLLSTLCLSSDLRHQISHFHYPQIYFSHYYSSSLPFMNKMNSGSRQIYMWRHNIWLSILLWWNLCNADIQVNLLFNLTEKFNLKFTSNMLWKIAKMMKKLNRGKLTKHFSKWITSFS